MKDNTEGSDFWSRRKAAVREAEEREASEEQAQSEAEKRAELEMMDDEDILREFDLPDPDTLESGDEVKRFLKTVIPERLKRRALRRLWALNPALANLDGLIDYGEDYTDAATVIEGLQTTYQVGKGMMAHVRKMAEDAEKAAAQAESESIVAAQTGTDANDDVSDESPDTVDDVTFDENAYEAASDPRTDDSRDDFALTDAANSGDSGIPSPLGGGVVYAGVGDHGPAEDSAIPDPARPRRMRFSYC